MAVDPALAAKYKGTAWECLYIERAPSPLTDKQLADKARRKANNDRNNALRKAKTKATFDNKLKANWTI